MEAFIEILLKRKMTLLARLRVIGLIFTVIFVSVIGICFSKVVLSLVPIVVFFNCFVIYYIVLYNDVEIEYIIIGDEIDVDKIFGKKKRKRLLTVKKGDIVLMGSVKDQGYLDCKKKSFRVIDVSSDKFDEENCYVLLNDNKKTLVIFKRDERLVKVIKR